jgi:hypothetical protein
MYYVAWILLLQLIGLMLSLFNVICTPFGGKSGISAACS